MVRGRFTGSFRSDDYGEPRSRRARSEKRRCGYCDGIGKVEEGDFIKSTVNCPVCEGTGYVSVPSNYIRCPDCDGMGKKNIGSPFPEWARCKRCRGTGWCEPPPPYR